VPQILLHFPTGDPKALSTQSVQLYCWQPWLSEVLTPEQAAEADRLRYCVP
jgi:uncharacterized phage protein gp47/JayE